MDLKSVQKPFGIAALIWAVLSVALCRFSTDSSAYFGVNLLWMAGLYLVSICDLVALGKSVEGMIFIAAGQGENRPVRAVQTFYWVLLKLLCLGIFIVVMIKAKSIPNASLLLGLGTVAIVPLLGGLFWSRTAHA